MTAVRSYSWDELAHLCRVLAAEVKRQEPNIDVIVGVSRGGLFPALMLSNLLQIRDVAAISVRTTINDDARAPRSTPVVTVLPPASAIRGRSCLIVDDVTNTGGTLQAAIRAIEALQPLSIVTAAMVWDTVGLEPGTTVAASMATLYAERVHAWVGVPWELRS